MLVAEVVPDIAAAEIEESYTYLVPPESGAKRGDAALVPFGGRTVVGYVLSVREASVDDFEYELKPIGGRIDGASLPEEVLRLLDFTEAQYLATPGACVAAAMPPGIRARLKTSYEKVSDEAGTPAQERILYALDARGALSAPTLERTPGFSKSAMKALLAKGAVRKIVSLPAERRRGPGAYVIADVRSAKAFIEAHGGQKPAQAECLEALMEAPQSGLTVSEISALAGVSETTVRALIDAGQLRELEPRAGTEGSPEHRRLNTDQAAALKDVSEALRAKRHDKFLLFGVTGSGKTEVYMRAIAESLATGRPALYLVPEIALTAQVVAQLRQRFGSAVAVMHSGLAAGERLRNWRRVAAGEAPVVVGARSAVFAPVTGLGLIIVDEEHDGSYKQENAPRYDGRRLAEWRAEQSGAVLLMGSATPSINSFHRAKRGELRLLRLPHRAAASSLPEVEIEDLREEYRKRSPSLLSRRLREELEAAVARKEQAMLFLNRRAFARSLLCRDCGFTPACPRCSVALTYHAKPPALRCHHCDHRAPVGDRCGRCGGLRIRPLGIGTQKVEEFLKRELPEIAVERLDRDVASRKGAVEEVFGRVRSGATQVLVGTQMIAKGLDFENVTLVGVIAADVGLSIPDYRSTERTFQLLTQVSGRAGRRKPGRVVIQTFSPDHPSIRLAAGQDYEAFFDAEIAEREDAGYPPFRRLVNLLVSGADRDEVDAAAQAVRQAVDSLGYGEAYGPAECALARLHGNWRKHVLVKLPPEFDVSQFPREFAVPRTVRLVIDVDPGSLM